jgi:CO/xanthine dehydrogenase Mo-binding subunit/xanthine dehydrogenase iron-sulfur cluster and FAD-binding subunit A
VWRGYEAPTRIDEALQLLDRHGSEARLIAGGTDLLVELRRSRASPPVLIDISRIEGLDRIGIDDDGWVRLGPMVTHNQAAASRELAEWAAPLVQACAEIGTPQIRNRGTIAGNLATASPANDTIAALSVLNARLTLRSTRGARAIPLSDFYLGVRETVLNRAEMVTDIAFRALQRNQFGAFMKMGLRRANAIAVANAAVMLALDGKLVCEARIALGSVYPTILRVPEAEKALIGKELIAETIARASMLAAESAAPIDDVRGGADYRREAVAYLVKRLLEDLPSYRPRPAGPRLWGKTDGRFASIKNKPSDGRIAVTVNGVEHFVTGAENKRLIDMLRDDLGLTGTKEGCGEGECGACTVWMDGIAVLACLVPAARAHGSEIVTVEGMARQDALHPLQQALIDRGAVQCGYCTPGFVMAGASLLDETSAPNAEQIRAGLSGNLCRCTGYYKILSAVEDAGKEHASSCRRSDYGEVGTSPPRVDARDKVTGAALYPGDYAMPGMLVAKILFSGRVHARIRGIDVISALALPGVVAVLTAKDVPVNERGLQIPDQPVLCGPGSAKEGADMVRFTGDQVAVIVAESEAVAEQARALVRVDYEDLPPLTDASEALASGALPLHSRRYEHEAHPELRTDGNRISHHQIRKGDVDSVWNQAEMIVESEYRTPAQEHAYLQPEAGLAYIDDQNRVTVMAAGQWTTEDQHQIAHALGLPQEQVRVIYPAIGGAFGGREDISIQIAIALAAWKLHRPVKIVWSREESILGHCKRHPFVIRSKWGATRKGKILAADIGMVADGGAYCYTTNKVLGNTTSTCVGPYEIPNVKVDVDGVYTNNTPSGAFRGFGSPQALFAAETQVNKLAHALQMDPVELRMRNLLHDGSLTAFGTALPKGVSLQDVTRKCAQAAGWIHDDQGWRKPELPRSGRLRGIGLATGFKNVGYSFGYHDNCRTKIELTGGPEIEKATVAIGSAEVGQGTHTTICQMAASALAIPIERVRILPTDTATSPGSSGSVSASRMTLMAGNAVRGAAEKALADWKKGARPAIGDLTYFAPITTPFDRETGRGFPNFSYGYVAVAAEVDVDPESGIVKVLRIVCVDDVGKAIHPQQVMGQIEGGVIQALGWVLTENFVTRNGRVLTPNFSTYLIPAAADIPDRIEALIVEHANPVGPWGVRGMGEMPLIAVAPALIAAVHDATGVWYDDFPLTPERVLHGLHKK